MCQSYSFGGQNCVLVENKKNRSRTTPLSETYNSKFVENEEINININNTATPGFIHLFLDNGTHFAIQRRGQFKTFHEFLIF